MAHLCKLVILGWEGGSVIKAAHKPEFRSLGHSKPHEQCVCQPACNSSPGRHTRKPQIKMANETGEY